MSSRDLLASKTCHCQSALNFFLTSSFGSAYISDACHLPLLPVFYLQLEFGDMCVE